MHACISVGTVMKTASLTERPRGRFYVSSKAPSPPLPQPSGSPSLPHPTLT
jgi:hypothetical protein